MTENNINNNQLSKACKIDRQKIHWIINQKKDISLDDIALLCNGLDYNAKIVFTKNKKNVKNINTKNNNISVKTETNNNSNNNDNKDNENNNKIMKGLDNMNNKIEFVKAIDNLANKSSLDSVKIEINLNDNELDQNSNELDQSEWFNNLLKLSSQEIVSDDDDELEQEFKEIREQRERDKIKKVNDKLVESAKKYHDSNKNIKKLEDIKITKQELEHYKQELRDKDKQVEAMGIVISVAWDKADRILYDSVGYVKSDIKEFYARGMQDLLKDIIEDNHGMSWDNGSNNSSVIDRGNRLVKCARVSKVLESWQSDNS